MVFGFGECDHRAPRVPPLLSPRWVENKQFTWVLMESWLEIAQGAPRITWTDLGFDDAGGMYSEKTDRSKGRQGAAIGAAIVQGQ